MPETTPLIKAALNLRGGAGFDVYSVSDSFPHLLFPTSTILKDNEGMNVSVIMKVMGKKIPIYFASVSNA